MSRSVSILGSLVFLGIAPGTIAGWIPWLISGWEFHPPFFGLWLQLAGAGLAAIGLIILLDSFGRFALQGRGTPAPILPTQRLVVTGWYQYVRNPMYVAVISIVLGQALIFSDVRLIAYGLVLWLGFHLFVLGYEEPTMRKSYAEDYAVFSANVPRWIPRLTRWRAPTV